MKRELKPEEHEEIVRAVAAGDRVKAKSIYLSATEGNLTEAQDFIKALPPHVPLTTDVFPARADLEPLQKKLR
jgi:hypothetical protein